MKKKSKNNKKTWSKDVYIGKGNLAGKGVFANRNFKEGEIVIKYSLEPLTQDEFIKLPTSEKMFTHKHWDKSVQYT